jgi:signal transduction histidine kinase
MFEIYGLPPLDPLTYERWIGTIFPEDLPVVEATRRRVIDEKRDDRVEFRIVRPDGSIRNVAAVEKVVLDGASDVVRVVGVNMDITERKVSERALERMREEELRFKDDFLSHVSHELRSPLTAIKQFSSILINGLAGELNSEQRRYEAIVLKNVHQLQSMIDDLLEVTRLETGKLTIELSQVTVQAVANDAVQTLAMTAGSKGVSMISEISSDLPSVHADATRLLQVLIILLDNAVKFTSSGGSVRINGRLLPEHSDYLLIEVSDTGCGIPPELLKKLFERLFQATEQSKASRKGLGLGLYICKELVMRQGGTISVTSKVGKGSTFSFTLPLFSLGRLILPLIKDGRWPSESAALLTVHLRLPGEAHSSESSAGPPHEARNFLQKCLLPDLDLLLPNSRSTAQGEYFFVAVFADQNGRAVLARRIREQFQGSRALNRAGRTLSLSYRLLPPFEREVGSSTEQVAAVMAASFENAIRSQSLPEGLHHEQQQETIGR